MSEQPDKLPVLECPRHSRSLARSRRAGIETLVTVAGGVIGGWTVVTLVATIASGPVALGIAAVAGALAGAVLADRFIAKRRSRSSSVG